MRRFKFRLERILSYRRSLTEAEKAHFATKVAAVLRAEEHASRLRGIRNETLIARIRALQYGTTATEVSNIHEHLIKVDEALGNALEKVEKTKFEMEQARQKLVERRRDQRAIELIKDRRFSSWLRDYYREEGKILDDIATIRYLRKQETE